MDRTKTEVVESEIIKEKLLRIGWNVLEWQDLLEVVGKYRLIDGVKKIWIYGSMARGEQDQKKEKSDMDVAVEVEDLDEAKWRRIDLIGEKSGRKIQINIFKAGYDESAATNIGSDMVTRQIRLDAQKRLKDQIVLWEQ